MTVLSRTLLAFKEEQNDWALAGGGPGVKGDTACVCCQGDWSRRGRY